MQKMVDRLGQAHHLRTRSPKLDFGRLAKVIRGQSPEVGSDEQKGGNEVKTPNSPISMPEAKKAKVATSDTAPSRTQ